MQTNLRRTLISLSVSMLVAACGGGGGGGSTTGTAADSGTQTGGSTNTGGSNTGANTGSNPGSTTVSMLMACPDTPDTGTAEQCSGSDVVFSPSEANGVLVTNSGVQVYGTSTSDLQKPIAHPESATGFTIATGGQAEVRLFKDAQNAVSKPVLLLKNLGIKWDGVKESPEIIETFRTDTGHVSLSGNKIINEALHPSSDTTWYDFITKGVNATQANYANNRYFPRTDAPRCPTGVTPCPTVETTGVKVAAGDWRNGGTGPDESSGTRLHEDGDVHAGDGVSGSTGPGVPFPGSKGYRDFFNMSYQYANVTKWVSQDTAEIAEWAGTANEHNLNRRGVIAFGDATDPTKMPTTGSGTYKGWVRGWYTPSAGTDPTPFLAEASITVNFSARTVSMTFANARTDDAAGSALQIMQFSTTANIGTGNTASYLTGGMTSGALKGGVAGRFFGPVSGTPAEIGASFSLSDTTSGAAAIGGFIAIKHAL